MGDASRTGWPAGCRPRAWARVTWWPSDLEAEQILDFIVTYSAVHKLGAVSVPMNNRLSPPEVRAILEHAEVTAVVCSGAYEDAVAPLLGIAPVAGRRGHRRRPSEHGRIRRPRGGEERGRLAHPGAPRRRRPGRRHVHVGDHGQAEGGRRPARQRRPAAQRAAGDGTDRRGSPPLRSSPSPVSASSTTR